MIGNKQMPHSIEAEQAVLGAAIVDPNQILKLSEKLQPHYFYVKINELIFKSIVEVFKKNNDVDLISLKNHLEGNGDLTTIGDYDYVVSLAEDISLAVNIEAYGDIVFEKYLLRETISRATSIVHNGYSMSDSSELIEFAEREIFNLSKLTRSAEFVDWDQLIDDKHKQIAALIASDQKGITGLATGFNNLDAITNGLQKSDLVIIAARPSVGKTAFALNMARNAMVSSFNIDPQIAFFSLEMSADQLLTRLLAAQSGVPISDLRTGNLTASNQEDVNYSLEQMKKFGLHVDETPGIKIGDLKSKARKLKLEVGLDMIVIDYLQLITTAGGSDNRQQEVSEISRELKGLAKELNIPVIALSQLSRGVEQRADKKPMMSDIRESGAIEQDADIIMMLYRPEYYGDNIDTGDEEIFEGKTSLIITKHRNGATGEIDFKFEKEINVFIARES